ncbi:MAG: AAC(3) family N-acetyltransferase [Acidimicrobiia bacterium]
MRLPAEAPTGPVMVHCDAGQTHRLVPRRGTRDELLDAHCHNLRQLADGRALWVPAFNYDYCRTGRYDVAHDAAQIGPVAERVRAHDAEWRTLTPVFNVAGVGQKPSAVSDLADTVDPFGSSSVFAELADLDGVIVWYGAPIHATTFIHHVERASGGPIYRYDKFFAGEVVNGPVVHRTTMRYHVRPMGRHLDYDWAGLEALMYAAKVLHRIDVDAPLLWASARALRELWLGALVADPLALVDEQSREWIEPELDRLGRPFLQSDFEQPKALAS